MRDRVSFDISTDRLDEAVGRFPNLQVIAEGSVKRPDVQPTVVPPTMAQLLRVPRTALWETCHRRNRVSAHPRAPARLETVSGDGSVEQFFSHAEIPDL